MLERVPGPVDAGPLPYQIENTPSTSRWASVSTCWVPRMAVAARSSLMAGRTGYRAAAGSALRHSSWSPRHQGRTPVARDKAGGVQAAAPVKFPLQHGQAHQGLGTCQENPALLPAIAILGIVVVKGRSRLMSFTGSTRQGIKDAHCSSAACRNVLSIW